MDKGRAMSMLTECLVDPILSDDTENVAQVLADLAYFPLAIVQAAAYINTTGCNLGGYAELLHEKSQKARSPLDESFDAEERHDDMRNPVAITCLISWEHIKQCDPLAAEYLSFMACVHNEDVPFRLLPSGPTRRRRLEAITTLETYCLAEMCNTGKALKLHRLVHLSVQDWLQKEDLLSLWREKTLLHLYNVFPSEARENRRIRRTYLPHALSVLASTETSGSRKLRTLLMEQCGRCLFSDGRWNEAETLFARVLASKKTTLESDASSVLASTAWLAATYLRQGRWEAAEELNKQAIEISTVKLGADHPQTLTCMANLASTYWSQERWDEAAKLNQRLMESSQVTLGATHPNTLTSMANLATTYWKRGLWQEAEMLDFQVMKTRETELGADHPDTLTSRADMATTYWKQGRWQEAEELDVQVLQTRRTLLGMDHPDTLASMTNLAVMYCQHGRWWEAEELEVKVTEISKRTLGANHPSTLASMRNLASTWHAMGWKAEAVRLLRTSIERQSQVFGRSHEFILSATRMLHEWETE